MEPTDEEVSLAASPNENDASQSKTNSTPIGRLSSEEWAGMSKGQRKRWIQKQKQQQAHQNTNASGSVAAASSANGSNNATPSAAASSTSSSVAVVTAIAASASVSSSSTVAAAAAPAVGGNKRAEARRRRRQNQQQKQAGQQLVAPEEDDEEEADKEAVEEKQQQQRASPKKQQQQVPKNTKNVNANAVVSEVEKLKAQVAQLQKELEAERLKTSVSVKTIMPFQIQAGNFSQPPPNFQMPVGGFSNVQLPSLPLPAFTFPQPTSFPATTLATTSTTPSFTNAVPAFTSAPFFQRPPEAVPFVPIIAPQPPLELEAVNSGASSHSDTSTEEENDEDEEDESGEDEEDLEDEEEDEEDEEEEDEDGEDEDDEDDDGGLEHSTASANDRHAEAMMDGEDDRDDSPPASALTKKDEGWLKRFRKLRAAKKGAVTAEEIQTGRLPPEIVTEQIAIERLHRSQLEALAAMNTPVQGSPLPTDDTTAAPSTSPSSTSLPLGQQAAPKNTALLQDCIRAYVYSIKEQELETRKRIKHQLYNFEHGIEDENDEADDEDEEDVEDEENDGDDGDDADDEDADIPEDEESEEEGLHKFMKAQFKKAPKKQKKKAKKEEESQEINEGDITLEEVEQKVDQLTINNDSIANPTASSSSSSTTATSAATASTSSSTSTPSIVTPPIIPALALTAATALPVAHTAAEAVQLSQSQITSPPPAHHGPAHKHHHHGVSTEPTAPTDASKEADHDDASADGSEAADEEEGEDDEEEDESAEESGGESDDDKFPYEKNLFSLAPSYHFIKRLYACADAVTYKAISKITNKIVAIKICDGYDGEVTPKEVRLLNSAQGHPNILVMCGWHPFASNHCYAIITEFIVNEPIETIFDRPALHKIYMRDLLHGLRHLHQRKIIFRDIKPSNVLWSSTLMKAFVIDFDVGSYFDPVNLHRSMVGTDGYMAPEMMLIKHAKRKKLPLPYKGYDLSVDVYAAGMVLGQLLFGVGEDDVADLDNHDSKGAAFIDRSLELSSRGQANLGHHLLIQMLNPEPKDRITVDDALKHPWFDV